MTVRLRRPASSGGAKLCSEPAGDASHGSLEMLRETAREQLHLCAFHCSLAVDHGEVQADAGMSYNTRRAVAHMRMATDALKMMAEHVERRSASREEGGGQ